MTLRSLSTSGISNALKKSNNPSLANSTGGVITTAGGYRIHTFSSVGTFTFTASGPGLVEYLVQDQAQKLALNKNG